MTLYEKGPFLISWKAWQMQKFNSMTSHVPWHLKLAAHYTNLCGLSQLNSHDLRTVQYLLTVGKTFIHMTDNTTRLASLFWRGCIIHIWHHSFSSMQNCWYLTGQFASSFGLSQTPTAKMNMFVSFPRPNATQLKIGLKTASYSCVPLSCTVCS